MTLHVPILYETVVNTLTQPFLDPAMGSGESAWMVDCTLGGGGHTSGFLAKLPPEHRVLAIDQDEHAVQAARQRFESEIHSGRIEILHAHMGELHEIVAGRRVLGFFADLGFSSDQIESKERGLSFQKEGPLDMRLDPSRGAPISEWLLAASEREMCEVFWELGEERFARPIARRLVSLRERGSFEDSTLWLADQIRGAVPASHRYSRIHPATRVFQAMRIWVNQELEELDSFLAQGLLHLSPGGRAGILSFHSLEDRRVKQRFRELEPDFRNLFKKPIVPDDVEIAANPRSRSAKLRVVERSLP